MLQKMKLSQNSLCTLVKIFYFSDTNDLENVKCNLFTFEMNDNFLVQFDTIISFSISEFSINKVSFIDYSYGICYHD